MTMGVVRIKSSGAGDKPVTGSGMDQVVETRKLSLRAKAAIAVVLVLVAAGLFWWYAPRGSSQIVGADRVTVSTVTRGTFDDFIPLRARVTPLLTVYIDAVEGGRVEKMLVEDGATLAKGQPIALLSNAELQLSTLARQTEVEQQINNMRSQELALAQTRLSNERAVLAAETVLDKAKRQYEREKPLAERGFIAGKQFADTSADYELGRRNLEALKRSEANDARLQGSQLSQQQAAAQSMQSGLAIARANLDVLQLRAPVAGQLSGFSVQVGQSLQRGERVGQIDSPGRNKLIAGVDEFYLGRVQVGQQARMDWAGKTFAAKVTKIYPQVQ
ncbi:MAG: HlyD family efflux transporter periplasmic adaptor subunit, partial [Sphingomonas sp.]